MLFQSWEWHGLRKNDSTPKKQEAANDHSWLWSFRNRLKDSYWLLNLTFSGTQQGVNQLYSFHSTTQSYTNFLSRAPSDEQLQNTKPPSTDHNLLANAELAGNCSGALGMDALNLNQIFGCDINWQWPLAFTNANLSVVFFTTAINTAKQQQ